MKKRVFLAAGIAVLSTAVLAACSSGNGNKEATKPVTYAYVFSSDPATLDYTVSGKNSTKQITGNVIDGLLENDQYGNLVPSVAEDWTVSKDGLTYTYKIRKGIKWYTNEGEEYGVKEQATVVHDTTVDIGLGIATEFLTINLKVITACELSFNA